MKPVKIAIVTSLFNSDVTLGLQKGALDTLKKNGLTKKHIALFDAPGAFEIPLIAQKLAQSKKFSGVICLGCVIKGDTAHFEFISLAATLGIQHSMLISETPISFGIITTYTDQQAIDRSRQNAHNKGSEAALACLQTLKTLEQIKKL